MAATNLLRISDAASLGLHAMAMLAASDGELVSTEDMATRVNASKHHLSKVMQTLSHAALVNAIRGPKGGFSLARPADEIRLLEIYEAIEGHIRIGGCLLGEPACGRNTCILGTLLGSVHKQFMDYFSNTTLLDLVEKESKK